jgi:hypothetical protein
MLFLTGNPNSAAPSSTTKTSTDLDEECQMDLQNAATLSWGHFHRQNQGVS